MLIFQQNFYTKTQPAKCLVSKLIFGIHTQQLARNINLSLLPLLLQPGSWDQAVLGHSVSSYTGNTQKKSCLLTHNTTIATLYRQLLTTFPWGKLVIKFLTWKSYPVRLIFISDLRALWSRGGARPCSHSGWLQSCRSFASKKALLQTELKNRWLGWVLCYGWTFRLRGCFVFNVLI